VTFTRDSLVVQRSGGIEVWDATGSQRRRTLPSDPSYLPGVAVGSDLAARMRRDRVMVVFNLATGEQIGAVRLAEQVGRYGRIGMTFDGDRRLVTAVSDQDLYAWDLSEENWVRAACSSAGRDLTPDEWRRYVGTAPPADLTCG